jgi:S-formylglutathione hydrolase FrmB
VTASVGVGLVLALASAVALNWGYFAQHGAAGSLPRLTLRRPLHSLGLLFTSRRWLVGFVSGIGGWALYVVALALAPLSLVQAAAAGGIGVLALLVRRLSASERVAVFVAIGGLALLAISLLGTQTPTAGGSAAAAAAWVVASLVVAALAVGPGRAFLARGAGFGTAAGVLYAAGDVSTKAALGGGGRLAFVPVLLACHGLAFVALQLGFQRGGALETAGMATLWTNALPIAAGTILFGEPIPGGNLGAVRVAAFAAVVAGAFLLSRSPTRTALAAAGAVVAAALIAASLTVARAAAARSADQPLPGFTLLDRGPDGGTVWTGRIVNPFVPGDARWTDIYLPPSFSPTTRYPVLYLLHGFWGSPSSFVDSLRFATVSDTLITDLQARPFIAVMPPGGPMTHRTGGEWAGVWESYVTRAVVPWTEAHLPTQGARGRGIAGLSSGAFGAVDMAVRHIGMFSVAESWEGYFQPFRDGPFVHASPSVLAAHDPALLARLHTAQLRARHVRFFVSTAASHGGVKRAWTLDFAAELRALRLPHQLWTWPANRRKGFLRAQLPAALVYAEPRTLEAARAVAP